MSNSSPILVMKGVSKAFAGVPALKNVDFELLPGEVHALMGENGAGKSTLMKILTGIYTRDAGEILLDGRPVVFDNPREAQEAGIVIVHQELNLMPHLTVAQNIFIGREKMRGKFIDDRQMVNDARDLFDLLNIDIDPAEVMGRLTVGRQQMCEIAKAISTSAKIIVFDEPTAALTETEVNELFKIIADLRDKGIGVIYISHRMDEIKRITDRVTVMRDGEYVGTLVTNDCTKDDIVRMMVGRVVYETPKTESAVPPDAPVVLKVEGLRAGRMVKDVSFELRRGEILGVAGLMGAGRTEMARALFGADARDAGEIHVNGKRLRAKTPEETVAAGISYLSEDRKRFGVMVEMDVTENTTLATLQDYVASVFIDSRKERETVRTYISQLRIKTPSERQQVRKLSGGNQQKIVIAKWLARNSQILIFDEPTRGIDVGAKAEIYELMHKLVEEGKSIIMISSELAKTRPGRYITALGSNKEATRLSGINIVKWESPAYVISGLFAGFAGIAYAATYSTVLPGTGNGFELDAIAGAVIGGTSLSGGVGSILGTIIGVFIMSVLKTGLPFVGLQPHYQLLFTGIVLVIAVFFDVMNRKRQKT